MNSQSSVPIEKLVKKMELVPRTEQVSLEGKALTTPEVNRPALQLTGYFDYFDADRLQVIGYVEYTYLDTLTRERKRVIYERLLAAKIPAIVYTRITIRKALKKNEQREEYIKRKVAEELARLQESGATIPTPDQPKTDPQDKTERENDHV